MQGLLRDGQAALLPGAGSSYQQTGKDKVCQVN